MSKIVAALATLLLFLTPASAQAIILKPEGGAVDRQCNYITTVDPAQADDWPGCAIYTSGKQTIKSGTAASPTREGPYIYTCTNSGSIGYTCWSWYSTGYFGEWKLVIDAYGTTYFPVAPSGSTSWHVDCNLSYANYVDIAFTDCGLLAETTTDYVVGAKYTSHTPTLLNVLQATIGWKTFIRCDKWSLICSQPATVKL